MKKPPHRRPTPALLAFWLLVAGCAGSPAPAPVGTDAPLAPVRYAIQAGAFAHLENAVRFSDRLEGSGLEPYHFADHDGLFKVRFGDFRSKAAAHRRAAALAAEDIIESYYVVGPLHRGPPTAASELRSRIVQTAEGYIGLPYRWGGASPAEGFDCSGLTMTVYRLNGLKLPRSSRQQFRRGVPVPKHRLRPGDLVFFATSGRAAVSHVGVYAGGGRFIHSPKSGGTIRSESMKNAYFSRRFAGARSYIR